jgi:predicted dithiol-disulfide oxidoreductase (DUF899 family)
MSNPNKPTLQHLRFPNESEGYRSARNALLEEEMELRRQLEHVANRRRSLPRGGVVPEDYVFEMASPSNDDDDRPIPIKLSDLFRDKQTLAVYSFMYGPERKRPCPGCTHFLDSIDGASVHINQRISFVVVAKSPVPRLLDFAKERGWQHLRLLSTAKNTYDRDYFGDSRALSLAMRQQQDFSDGKESDMPMMNIFHRDNDSKIRHTWGSELLYVPPEPGQQYRHNDLLDPLYNMLDLVPEGRGDFEAKLSYA